MTDDEIVTLGSFCEALMCHSAFGGCFFRHITNKKKREGIYKTNYCNHRLGAAGCGP